MEMDVCGMTRNPASLSFDCCCWHLKSRIGWPLLLRFAGTSSILTLIALAPASDVVMLCGLHVVCLSPASQRADHFIQVEVEGAYLPDYVLHYLASRLAPVPCTYRSSIIFFIYIIIIIKDHPSSIIMHHPNTSLDAIFISSRP
jgi:hypothetical protein